MRRSAARRRCRSACRRQSSARYSRSPWRWRRSRPSCRSPACGGQIPQKCSEGAILSVSTIARGTGGRRVPLALRNLLANKRRLVRSSAGIGFAVLLMLVQLGFERGFFDASLATVRQLDGDLVIMGASKYAFGSADPFSPSHLDSAAKVAGIATVAPLHA